MASALFDRKIKDKKKTLAKIIIGKYYQITSLAISSLHLLLIIVTSIFYLMVIESNINGYISLTKADLSVFCFLYIEQFICLYIFRKNYTRVHKNISIIVLTSINLIIDITIIVNFNGFTNFVDDFQSEDLFQVGLRAFTNLMFYKYKQKEIRSRFRNLGGNSYSLH